MSKPLNQDWMYDELAAFGYPCFAPHGGGTPTYTPASFLAHVLDLPEVEPRVVDGLPWLVYAFPLMEWDWLIEEMRLRGRQNRLGFLVDLAIELAETLGETARVKRLQPQRDLLNLIKLDEDETPCNEQMTEGMRTLRRDRRSTTAAHWNLACDTELKHLHYTPQYELNMNSCEAMIPETELRETLKPFERRCLKRPNHKKEHLSFSRSWRDGDQVSTLRPRKMWVGRDEPADVTLMTATPRSPDEFEQMFAEWDTPESKLKLEQEDRFLREVIYDGLTDLNTGFDSPLIGHFSPEDFLTVIDRCESLNVRIIGIEVFTTDVDPPWKVKMLWIEISSEDGGYDWARRSVRKYMERSDITISATFDVPGAVLESN
jgi:hypothetical protein